MILPDSPALPCQQTHFGAFATGNSCLAEPHGILLMLAAISPNSDMKGDIELCPAYSEQKPFVLIRGFNPPKNNGFLITFMWFQTKNNEDPWISHPTAHNNCHPIPTSQFAEPFLPESRSREIHPGFTMAQRRSGTAQ